MSNINNTYSEICRKSICLAMCWNARYVYTCDFNFLEIAHTNFLSSTRKTTTPPSILDRNNKSMNSESCILHCKKALPSSFRFFLILYIWTETLCRANLLRGVYYTDFGSGMDFGYVMVWCGTAVVRKSVKGSGRNA